MVTLLWGAFLLALLVACSENGGETIDDTVDVDHPLNARVNCTQGETPTCELIVKIMAADADIEPDFQGLMLPGAQFSTDDDRITVENETEPKQFTANMDPLGHQQWREFRVNLIRRPGIFHSGCYVIRVHAGDNLPDKYYDETQVFVYAENGELKFYQKEQDFLNKLNVEFHNIPDSPLAYGIKINGEDSTRGELFIKIAGLDNEIEDSRLAIDTDSGIEFDDTEDIQVNSFNGFSSDTESTWPNGYRIVVVPFHLDPEDDPGRRTLMVDYFYKLKDSPVEMQWQELAPLAVTFDRLDGGDDKLQSEIVEASVRINGPTNGQNSLGGIAPELDICTNGYGWTRAVDNISGTPEQIYRNYVALQGIMTFKDFKILAALYNPELQMERLTNGGNYTFDMGTIYMLPECVSN